MRQFVTLPNAMTSGNLTAGFLALLVTQANLLLAAALVMFAAALDSLDGVAARRTPTKDPFGANLDSLADLVSFGVVPAVALYAGTLHTLPALGLAACLGFLLCGAWRLARFLLVKNSRYFVGLPIPPAGVLMMLLALWNPSPLLALLSTSALSALMVSTVPFPTLSTSLRGAASIPRHTAHLRLPRRRIQVAEKSEEL